MFNRQQKSVTTSTTQGSSSSSTVKRTVITTSTTFHSQSSSTSFEISTDPTIRETTSCIEQLSIEHPPNTVISRNIPSIQETTSCIEKLSIKQPSDATVSCKKENFAPPESEPPSNANRIERFEVDCLNAHNEYRRIHGVGPLKLNPNLSKFAQNWANTIASKRQLQHSSERKYGENIFWSSGRAINGKAPVDSWYDEIKQYNYKNASFSPGTGHFTQVVWKSTSDLGVGMASVGNEVYVVANYYPPGNYSNEFSRNVLPPK